MTETTPSDSTLRLEPSANRKHQRQRTLFQTAVLVLLIGGLGGCIGGAPPMRSAEPEPPPCASRIPTTKKLWHIVGDATNNQVSTCFRSDSDEGLRGKVLRAGFVCSMIPVTPPVVAGFALAFTPLFLPIDLVETAFTCAEIGAPEPLPTDPAAATPGRHSPAGDQRSSPSSRTP